MAVKIRLKRMGRTHRPFYRVNAVNSRSPRDGAVLEQLGFYDPISKDEAKKFVVDLDRRTQHLTAAEIAATIGDRFAPERIAEAYVAEYRHLRAR